MASDYKKLFEELEEFKGEQDKQKQRGLNNYNILTTVLKEHDEVRLHSRMLASFLDPSGEHYQSTLFLDKFLEILDIPDFKIIPKNCFVYKEYRNIDLYITDGERHIIIENKIYAKDQKEQIKRYIESIEKENKKLSINNILVIYLTLDRENPSSYSLGDLSIDSNVIKRGSESIALFKPIYYKREILKWLEISKYEIQNITNLNEVFKQYIDVVKMINNKYKDKIMNLSDYVQKNKEVYKLAKELEKELPTVRKNIVNRFFEKIISLLQAELGNEWRIELVGNLEKKYNGNLHIYKECWINSNDNSLIFAFEFASNNYNDGYFGVMRKSENVDIEGNIIPEFKSKLNKLNCKCETDKWYLHSEWLPNNTNKIEDFVEYVLFHKDAEKKISDRIMKLIKIFEQNTNLMTEMNEYLGRVS